MTRRAWIVETAPDIFDEVKAESFRVDGGALTFTDEGAPVLAFALGQWITVTLDEE